jgi:hypothetical protein
MTPWYRTPIGWGVIAGYVLLLAFDAWLFFVFYDAPAATQLSTVLQLVGFYTLVLGALSEVSPLKNAGLVQGLTSSSLIVFVRDLFIVASLVMTAWAVAADPLKSTNEGGRARALARRVGRPIATALRTTVGVAMLTIFLVVVAPLAFVAYWLAAIPIRSISTSARDLSLEIADTRDPGPVESFPIQQIVQEHRVAVTNFLIAAVTLILSVVLPIAFGD